MTDEADARQLLVSAMMAVGVGNGGCGCSSSGSSLVHVRIITGSTFGSASS
ncbi:putative major facilitator superfamily domain-containing protein [Helianthus anomalus]